MAIYQKHHKSRKYIITRNGIHLQALSRIRILSWLWTVGDLLVVYRVRGVVISRDDIIKVAKVLVAYRVELCHSHRGRVASIRGLPYLQSTSTYYVERLSPQLWHPHVCVPCLSLSWTSFSRQSDLKPLYRLLLFDLSALIRVAVPLYCTSSAFRASRQDDEKRQDEDIDDWQRR